MSYDYLRLSLHNFKCHHNKQVVYTNEEINKLTEPTGSGKSTLFEAIRWCLYGDVKKIYPHNLNDKVQTWVFIELSWIHIYRQRNPGLLTVKYKGQEYNDKNSSQSVIDFCFGQRDVWIATSYIAQDLRHPLMISSSEYCINVLNHLAFQGQEPRKIIGSIIQRKNKCLNLLQRQDSAFKRECELLQNSIHQIGNYIQYYYTPEQMSVMISSLQTERQTHDTLRHHQLDNSQNKGRLLTLQSSLNQISSTLVIFDVNVVQTQISMLQELRTSLQIKYDSRLKLDQELQSNVDSLLLVKQTTIDDPAPFQYPSFQIRNIVQPTEPNWVNIKQEAEFKYTSLLTEQQHQLDGITPLLTETKDQTQQYQTQIDHTQAEIKHWQAIGITSSQQLAVLLAQALNMEDKHQTYSTQSLELGLEYNADIIKSELHRIEQRINQLNSLINQWTNYNLLLIKYQSFRDQADALGCEYNESGKEQYVTQKLLDIHQFNEFKTKIEHQQIYNRETNHIRSLQQESLNLSAQGVVTDEQLTESKNILTQLQQAQGVHQCPHCSLGIRIVQGQLHPDQVIPNLQDQIQQQQAYLDYAVLANVRHRRIKQLEIDIAKRTQDIARYNMDLSDDNTQLEQQFEDIQSKIAGTKNNVLAGQQLVIIACPVKPELDVGQKCESESDSKDIISKLQLERTELQQRQQKIGTLEIVQLPNISSSQYQEQLNQSQEKERERTENLQILYTRIDNLRTRHNEAQRQYEQYNRQAEDINRQLKETRTLYDSIPVEIQIQQQTYNKLYEQYKLDCDIELSRQLQHEKLQEQAYITYQENCTRIANRKLEREQNILQYEQKINLLQSQCREQLIDWVCKTVVADKTYTLSGQGLQYLRQCQEIIYQLQKAIETYQSRQTQIESLTTQLKSIIIDDTIDAKVQDSQTMITRLEQGIKWGQEVHKIYNWKDKLQTEQGAITQLSDDVSDWDQLQHLALSIEHTLLDDTVNQINNILDSVCSDLFDGPIRVTLCLIKSLKSKNEERPKFNIQVTYHGVDYDSVNSMCGGEKDRISFALSIALADLTHSPFILLDECKCLYSIGSELKAKALTFLSKKLSHKIICLIDHVPLANDDKDVGLIDAFA